MPLQFIITDAGRAAIAQVGGAIGPVTLTKIAIGSAGYTPLANRTALQTEIKRLDPSGSSVPVPGTISITAADNSADSYSVREIGLYTNNNVLFAICAQTGVIMTKGSGSSALFAMDFVMTNVPAGTVTVGNVGFTYSQATETAMGVLGIATTAEAQAGTINTKIITPLRLAEVTATESRRGVIALATTTEAQSLVPDATKALTVARLVDRTATTGRAGVVVLASSADTQTGTDTAKAITPAGLDSRTATESRAGIVQLASTAEASAGTITTKAVTPAALKSSLAAYSGSGHTHDAAAIVSGTLNNARLTPATSTVAGIVELADNTETQAGTSTSLAVTPAGLASRTANTDRAGIVELADNSETQTGTDATRAVTPAGLASRTATDARAGIVELADNTETQTGTDTTRAVTPSSLASRTATESRSGIVELATSAETQTGTDTARAVTPAGLASRTANTDRAGIVELATNAETQTGTDTARAVTPASLASAAALFVPPGAVMPFAMNAAPSGWLAANGAAVSRTTYAALFTAIGTTYGAGDGNTTFALPDLRGYFVRGSGTNSADGTASGAFGQRQTDAFASHNHPASSNTEGAHTHTYSDKFIQGGFNQTASSGSAQYSVTENRNTGSAGAHTHTITIGSNGDTETRPKNIALLYCIKI